MGLTTQQKQIRCILISVARGDQKTHKPGLISYKELWLLGPLSHEKWGRGKKNQIVDWITKISGHDLAKNRPPLNELVIVKGEQEPGESWSSIKNYLQKTFGVKTNISSHLQAQQACWRYWGRKSHQDITRICSKYLDEDTLGIGYEDENLDEAQEGEKQDRTAIFRKRNKKLIFARKEKDSYTCQACGFSLEVNGRFIIDCHHTNPIGLIDDVAITKIDDLICLCPTCHRIAHTKRYPLSLVEIQAELKKNT